MNTIESQFRVWFIDSLTPLRSDGNAGFIFVLTAFPLLERYLRRKTNCVDGQNLADGFFSEVKAMLAIDGRKFWSCYRNGLLHQASFATGKWNKNSEIWLNLPQSGFSGHDSRPVYFDPTLNQFFLNPLAFYDAVTATILSDFSTYERDNTPYFVLPKVGDVSSIGHAGLSDCTGSYFP